MIFTLYFIKINSMKKRPFILLLVVLVIVFQFISCNNSRKKNNDRLTNKNYNLILIISDALRFDVLGCYGGEALTPNIDSLAENGTLFLNAYSTSPWTAPSSVCMMTGHYATTFSNGTRVLSKFDKKPSFFVPDSFQVFPEILAEKNYDTKISCNNVNATISNNMQGLEKFRHFITLKHENIETIKKLTGIKPYNNDYKLIFSVLSNILHSNENNFFMVIWINDPHSPYDPIPKFKSSIDFEYPKLPRGSDFYTSIRDFHSWENEERTVAEINFIKKLYIAEVESVDERVGAIMKLLEYKNLLEDTYVIFSSDHGEAFGQHGFFSHGTMYYEDLVHVPLIYSGPGIKKNRKIKTYVSHLDLMPTIVDLLGAKTNLTFQSESYMPLLFGQRMRSRSQYFDGVNNFGINEVKYTDAFFEEGYKLISLENGQLELYKLENDPLELNNLFSEMRPRAYKLFDKIREIRINNIKLNKEFLKDAPQKPLENKKEMIENLRALGYIKTP